MSSIRVSRVGRVSSVSATLTVTVRVSRVSVMVSVRDSVKYVGPTVVNKAPTSQGLPGFFNLLTVHFADY